MSTLVYFLFSGAIILFMMRYGCGAHVMGHGRHPSSTKTDGAAPANGVTWTPPSKAIDPVCGMSIEPADSKSTVHGGHVFYFCSQNCREKFEASPKSFMGNSASQPRSMEHNDEHQPQAI